MTACPLHSVCHDLYPAVCRCLTDYIFDETTNTCKRVDDQVFKMTGLHLNKQFLPSYTTTASAEFTRLALHVEEQLMASYLLDRNIILGVKVVAARKGSIILDLLFLKSHNVTSKDAFKYVVQSITTKQTSVAQILDINQNRIPLLVGFDEIDVDGKIVDCELAQSKVSVAI